VTEGAGHACDSSAQRTATSTRTAALAASALATWIAALCVGAPERRAEREAPPELPAVEIACGATADLALDRARRSEDAACAAVERYPFDPREALRALALLSEAAGCAHLAGDETAAARITARSRAWRTRVERDYRDHLTRYRLATLGQRHERAAEEIDFLLALLDGDRGAFFARLRRERAAIAARDDARATETR
jgi:hypothetical protein